MVVCIGLGPERVDELINENRYAMGQLIFRILWPGGPAGDHEATAINQNRSIRGKEVVKHAK